MSKFEELSAPKGRLVFKVIRGGETIRVASSNLIVGGGRNAMAKLLAGQTGMHAAKVGVGTNATAPDVTDTVLTGWTHEVEGQTVTDEPVAVNISEVRVGTGLEADDGSTFDDPNAVQFHFVFGVSSAVGVPISEYGLILADGTLFSRVVRMAPFTKTNLDKIVGFWQITF